MIVVHISNVIDGTLGGVSVAAPLHADWQSQYGDVALYNLRGPLKERMAFQLRTDGAFDLKQFPSPYSQPDLVVFHEVYYPAYLTISKKLNQSNIPYIILPHGCLRKQAQRIKRAKKIVGNALLFNRFINGSIAIQCLSEAEKAETPFGNCKIVSPNGVAIPNKEAYGSKRGVRFIYIGRIDVHIKGLDLLLEAMRRTQGSMRETGSSLHLYGPDVSQGHCYINETAKEFGIDDFVHCYEGITGQEKENILLESDVFIQPSRSEGMPMGVLEALSYAIPCLVTTGTGLADDISYYRAGWTASVDESSIADAIERILLGGYDKKALSKQAKMLASNKYAWNIVAKDALDKYEKLLH